MSTVVFAGGAQFLAVGLIAAGNPIAAVFAGLLLNARHLPFGLAVSETVGPRWRDRLIGSHLMTDEVGRVHPGASRTRSAAAARTG